MQCALSRKAAYLPQMEGSGYCDCLQVEHTWTAKEARRYLVEGTLPNIPQIGKPHWVFETPFTRNRMPRLPEVDLSMMAYFGRVPSTCVFIYGWTEGWKMAQVKSNELRLEAIPGRSKAQCVWKHDGTTSLFETEAGVDAQAIGA